DDYEEALDTDEIDLRELEDRRRRGQMVTVRGLVRSLNGLLDRHGVRERLVALRSGDAREIYVAMSETDAVALARGGGGEEEDGEGVMELGGCWRLGPPPPALPGTSRPRGDDLPPRWVRWELRARPLRGFAPRLDGRRGEAAEPPYRARGGGPPPSC